MKKITVLILLIFSFLLSSCNGLYSNMEQPKKVVPVGDPKLNDLNVKDDINLPIPEGTEIPEEVLSEVKDRKIGFSKLNEKKAYYKKIENDLRLNIDNFREYVEITRLLMLSDLKIVKSSLNGFLPESSINKSNYFYKYIKENSKNKEKKKEIINDINGLLTILSDKNKFNYYYYLNFDLGQTLKLNLSTKKIFFYTNLYLKNVKYNDIVVTMLSHIYKDMKTLKIKKYALYPDGEVGFLKDNVSYINLEPIENLYKKLK